MSDKCENAIIFIGANYRPLSGVIAVSRSYIESPVFFERSFAQLLLVD